LNLKLEKFRIRVKLTPYNLSTAILTALASRIFIIFNAILGSYFIPIVNPNAWDTGLPILNLFARWDAGHYFRIADQGYDRSNLGAFPLYPLILKMTSTPLEPFMPKLWALNIASFTISNIFFFISIIGLYRLTYKVFQDNRIAFASTAFLSFYPTSVFLSAAYAESLTLALTLWSFVMLEERKLVKSSILAFLAGLSRPIGFLASVPILLSGLKDRSIKETALAMFSASSIIVFDAYRYTLTGNFYTLSTLYGC
jgi:Gpi18-like mannosyltransferase